MSRNTKEKIMETALILFSQKGYLGTSMNDIASEVGITKGALYKHYESKQAILEAIIKEMERLDAEWAEKYGMPAENVYEGTDGLISPEAIRGFSMSQFRRWTEDTFSSQFRKMLTLEQYRNDFMSRLYQDYLSIGPAHYMAMIFCAMGASEDEALRLAVEFYGPMYFLYSAYDCSNDEEEAIRMLGAHIDEFFEKNLKEAKLKWK